MCKAFFTFLCLVLILCKTSCQSNRSRLDSVQINLNDSTEVVGFIKKSSLCNKLKYIEKNKFPFCKGVGYSGLILESVSKESSKDIFIPIATGGVILSGKQQEKELQDQIWEIKKKFECR